MKNFKLYFLLLLIPLFVSGQNKNELSVIAYYMGDDKQIDEYDASKLTHIIFSFCHLKDAKLSVDNAKDSITIKHLVTLKDKNPKLKIMLSLGGWGGCEPCSEVFASAEKRLIFAKSVKEINNYFKCDGLDLDWEYPTIEGHPGHLYQKADKENFTDLIVLLRKELGTNNELSFAAGGFQKYLDESVEWKKIMLLVDRVNIMSYDLVNGYSKVTGHHTPLFSTSALEESTNRAVEFLLNLGIPANKLVIGAAFYTRVWKDVANVNNGLYQSGVATNGVNFKDYETTFTKENGWNHYWDAKAKAPYWYNEKEKSFATGDDITSVKEKTNYAIKKKLGGIMFWELTLDKSQNGMVDAIDSVKKSK
ncbi:glycoside hydrolase family 18 protein [Flavobacterium sp.]|uniref:glycoside hydrolase family 18 protein n=1 Tax=Flavobacterium sp. TaxID=239 RepID=UPI002C012A25|nr:glycosyl hydrolase family 18 protein [Flavobacterium sp.]HSD08669.1 glycosyl hydrolase family 18 protein [Flavobacterium sp.]